MKKILPLLPILILGSLIYASSEYLTVPPVSAAHPMYIQMDAVAHVCLYFFLGLLVTRYVLVSLQVNSIGALVIGVALCVTFGVLDEFHQMYVPFRSAEFRDLFWDLVGATAGGMLYVLVVGFGRWIKDFLSSAEIDTIRVLGRATVAVVFFVGITVPTVVYSGRILEFVQSVVAEGSLYASSAVDSYLQVSKVTSKSRQPLTPKVQAASKLASLMPLLQSIPLPADMPALSSPALPEKTIDIRDAQPEKMEVKPQPAKVLPDKRLEQLGKELLEEFIKASSAGGSPGQSRAMVSSAAERVKEDPGYAYAIGAIAKNPVLRNKIVRAVRSSLPKVRQAVYTWQGRAQPAKGSRLFGVGDRKPDPCDLVVVITERSFPVNELTVDQVRKIFSGAYANWNEVGGPDQPIKVVTVRKQLGDLEKSLTDHLETGLSPNAVRLPFISLMIPVVAETKGAVGFLPVRNTEQLDWVVSHEGFKRIGIKNSETSPSVKPNRMALNTGQYPFMKSIGPVVGIDRKAQQYTFASRNGRGRAQPAP